MREVRLPSLVAVSLLFAGCAITDTDPDSETESVAALGHGHGHGNGHGHDNGRGQTVRVMTRNVYLGADLTPAIVAPDLTAFVAATGGVLRQVTATNFPVRAKGLAAEIRAAKPDLVGLQEVALWRTGPASLVPLVSDVKTATTVRYDFLQLLLDELNGCGEHYEPAVIQEELDFEAPADENGVAGDGPPPIANAELNARLTMRDVILVRVGGGVHVKNGNSGHFQVVLNLPVLGSSVASTRGWTSLDARVRGSSWFRFVNTHLEAFDPPVLVPSIRALQAGELVAPGGPATGELPVVLVGDLNSDDDTVSAGDAQAYNALLDAGFVERTSEEPSCCIDSFDLTGGTAADFTQQIDHVMTDAPEVVRLVASFLTGTVKRHGYWDSDHAGVVSTLRIR